MVARLERAKPKGLAYLEATNLDAVYLGAVYLDVVYLETRQDVSQICLMPADTSELEAVAKLGVDLAGVVVVEAAEGEAVIEQDTTVGYVDCGD